MEFTPNEEWNRGFNDGYAWAKIHWNGKTMKLPEGFSLCLNAYFNGFDEGARCWRSESKL